MTVATTIKSLLAAVVMGIFCAFPSRSMAPVDTVQLTDDQIYFGVLISNPHEASQKFKKHFTWGLEIGSSVDLTGYDLTTFNADLCIGYKNPILHLIGIGMGVHRAFGNGNAFAPLYFIIRSALRSKPSPFFIDLRAGYSFNTISNEKYRGGFKMTIGAGYILTRGNKVNTFVTLGYGYYHINASQTQNLSMDINHADYAIMSFGVNF